MEQELSKQHLEQEQLLADECLESHVNVVKGAVGPSYWLQISVEGLTVPALVDMGSQAMIISRSLLHKIFQHLKKKGKELPKLVPPSTKFKGKGGHPIDVTTQVTFTLTLDGQSATIPVFVQPNSEQECLLGSNVLPSLSIAVIHANGKPLTAAIENNTTPARVNLVQATALPGMKECYAKVQIDTEQYRGSDQLFEPEHRVLETLGVSAIESLISVDSNGIALIPLKNYQAVRVKLDK